MQRTARLLFSVALTVFFAFISHAAEAQNIGSVEIKSAEMVRCGKLAQDPQSTSPRGFLQFASAPKGKSFLVLHLKLKLTAGKDEDGDDRVQIEKKSISLVDAAGKGSTAVGSCSVDGRFSMYTGDYSHYDKPKDKLYEYHPVFVIADGDKPYTLKMDKAEFKLQPPMEVKETIKRAGVAEFSITKVAVVDKLENEEDLGDFESKQGKSKIAVESTVEKFLVVTLLIKPKKSNQESSFYVSSSEFGVLYGAQVYASPVGVIQEYNDEFYGDSDGYSSEPDVVGAYKAHQAKLVFPLPGRISKFKLLYLLEEIAEGTVPK